MGTSTKLKTIEELKSKLDDKGLDTESIVSMLRLLEFDYTIMSMENLIEGETTHKKVPEWIYCLHSVIGIFEEHI